MDGRRSMLAAVVMIVAALCVPSVRGQDVYGPPLTDAIPTMRTNAIGFSDSGSSGLNPLTILDTAAWTFSGQGQRPSAGSDAGRASDGLSAGLSIMILLTVITLVPSIMLMTTCFVRIIIVLALLKQALGTQSLPPPQVTLGLALFMTLLVMTPTIDRIYTEAVGPYERGEIRDIDVLWDRAKQPVRDFMFDQIERTGNWSSVYMILNYRGIDTSQPEMLTRADVDMVSLVPAYMLSELKTAFLMGFRVYLPFLVIDMVIASLLISMSMMMLPPVLISLPFKLLLFVLVDGWQLVVGSLMQSFVRDTRGGGGVEAAMMADPVSPVTSALAIGVLLLMVAPRRLRLGDGREWDVGCRTCGLRDLAAVAKRR